MNARVRIGRLAALGLVLILIVGVIAALASTISNNLAGPPVAVRGLISSDKGPFFADRQVVATLRHGGLDVTVQAAGSGEIATTDLTGQDFAFPAGVPAAEKIRRDHPGTTSTVPFFTPMAIATWQPIVDLLTAAGVIQQRTGYLAFDLGAYMQLVARDMRWSDLPGNTTYPVNKSILVTTTDVRRSNSAAMYLSLVSYVLNGNNIVGSTSDIQAITDQVAPLFLRQGFEESGTEDPFSDYLVQGIGKAPLVMIYEAQYLARAAANDGTIGADMVLVYPEPTIFSKHTLVGLDANGSRLGDFLTNDIGMRTLETNYGFRTSDAVAFKTFVTSHTLPVPGSIVDVIDPPTYETLEAMITRLDDIYAGATLPPEAGPTPEAPPTVPPVSPTTSPSSPTPPPSPTTSPGAIPL
jgi:hypothetical protein